MDNRMATISDAELIHALLEIAAFFSISAVGTYWLLLKGQSS
jgi:hypothetical protein